VQGRRGRQARLAVPRAVATLLLDGKTLGRHYAGPTWKLADGSVLIGKVVGRASVPSAKDIPWLKLEVSERRGTGTLSGVTTVQRIKTRAVRPRVPAIVPVSI
jgi:hypothetical protein